LQVYHAILMTSDPYGRGARHNVTSERRRSK
jgi:hypothetical protein